VSANENEQKGGDFGNLPAWPKEAEERPEEPSLGPPRARMKWFFGSGLIGSMFGLLTTAGRNSAVVAGAMCGGFILLGLIGLIIELTLFDRERKRSKWEDD